MSVIDDAEAILGRSVAPGVMRVLTADLNERLRVREMEEEYLTEPQPVVPLPSFYLDAVSVTIDDAPLRATSRDALRPGTFAVVGDCIHLADSGTLLRLIYRARIAEFEEERSVKVQTAYPALYLYGLLAHHAVLVRDEAGAAAWRPQYENALRLANVNDTRARQSESLARPTPRYCA